MHTVHQPPGTGEQARRRASPRTSPRVLEAEAARRGLPPEAA